MHAHELTSGVSLAELLPERRFANATDIKVHSCCHDYRHCRPGDLHVALVTSEDDGHLHVDKAVERGAVAVLCEQMLPTSAPQCVVPNAKEALAMLCQRLVDDPAQRIPVSGTVGIGNRPVAIA